MRAVTTKDEERGSSEPVSNWNKQTSGISLGDDRAPTATCNIPSFQTSTEDGSQCVAIGQAADRQSRPRKVGAGKRRTGRPLAYTGDPDSTALSEADKRKIKRRISNRESAQRIKNRHEEQIETLTAEVEKLREDQAVLKIRAEEAEQENARLAHCVEDWRGRAAAAVSEYQQLKQEAWSLRRAYEANLGVLENALSKPNSTLEQSKQQEQKQLVETPFAATGNCLPPTGLFDGQGGLEKMLLDPDFDPRSAYQQHVEQYGSFNQCKLPSLTESAEFALAAFTQALAR